MARCRTVTLILIALWWIWVSTFSMLSLSPSSLVHYLTSSVRSGSWSPLEFKTRRRHFTISLSVLWSLKMDATRFLYPGRGFMTHYLQITNCAWAGYMGCYAAILKEYDSIIREQLQRGIVEPVSVSEGSTITPHYLPNHAIVRQDKSTTKV